MKFHPPRKSYRGYIFDCDGTLADSMPMHLRAWNYALEQAKAPLRIDPAAFMSVAGMAIEQTIQFWNELHSLKIDAEVVLREKILFFDQHYTEIKPIKEVVAFARSCKSNGAAISVASGGVLVDVCKTLKVIGLDEFFPVIVTADDVERSKPAPDMFMLAAERMDIPPGECLVLEDSPLGIQAAEACGMDSVIIPHNF